MYLFLDPPPDGKWSLKVGIPGSRPTDVKQTFLVTVT